jgi:hypothetical protein
VVGVQTLVRRLHESDRLKSIDERRGKLKVHRILCGSRLEVLHLPADVLEHSVGETGPIGPSTDAKDDLPGSHEIGRFALVNGCLSLGRSSFRYRPVPPGPSRNSLQTPRTARTVFSRGVLNAALTTTAV